jgi:hypothetical protein
MTLQSLFGDSGHSLKLLAGQEVLVMKTNTVFNQVWGFPDFFTGPEAYKLVSQGLLKQLYKYIQS